MEVILIIFVYFYLGLICSYSFFTDKVNIDVFFMNLILINYCYYNKKYKKY